MAWQTRESGKLVADIRNPDLPVDVLLLAGLALILVLTLVNGVITLRALRSLQRHMDEQDRQIAALREEAVFRAPAKSAVAAFIISSREKTETLENIENQLAQLLNEWDSVEDLAQETYEILRQMREGDDSSGTSG